MTPKVSNQLSSWDEWYFVKQDFAIELVIIAAVVRAAVREAFAAAAMGLATVEQ